MHGYKKTVYTNSEKQMPPLLKCNVMPLYHPFQCNAACRSPSSPSVDSCKSYALYSCCVEFLSYCFLSTYPSHINRLVEAQHAIAPQEPIHSIRRPMLSRLRNLQSNTIIRHAVCDVADKDQARRLDALDERWREIEQPRAANETHEVVVARDLHRFFDRDGRSP